MSAFHGNNWTCPGCGIRYRDFTTGLTYNDVHKMMWDTSPDPNEWRYKRRGTVLGLWHQTKMELWERHIDGCFETHTGEVPF